jgi:hypothetical protein
MRRDTTYGLVFALVIMTGLLLGLIQAAAPLVYWIGVLEDRAHRQQVERDWE